MVIKYNAIFKDDSTFNLFGEEYFNDRVKFNRVHTQIDFLLNDEFDAWFKKHQ